jgi:16S rRNA (cytosine967-C5)-methyltransferase
VREGARVAAVISLLEATEAAEKSEGLPADELLRQYLKTRRYIGSKDRRAITELFYRVLRRRARLTWWLARLGHEPDARNLLLAYLALAVKDLDPAGLFDGQGYSPPALSEAEVALHADLVGSPLTHPDQPLGIRLECPDWLLPLFAESFGPDRLDCELAALNEEAPFDLRVNSLKTTREEVAARLAADGLAVELTRLSPWGLRLAKRVSLQDHPLFRDRSIEPQDEGSQVAALMTGAYPGARVLDYCAGAGGKTLALAAVMKGQGELMACDLAPQRLARARPRLARAGLDWVVLRPLPAPAGDLPDGSFDRVLVDASCSTTGAWRRGPQARWRLTKEALAQYQAAQQAALREAAAKVAVGGHLVYATCSLLTCENEDQVTAFLAARSDFRQLPAADVWAELAGDYGLGAYPGEADREALQLTPARHGCDGFFVAVLERA